jgi:CBS domain-containing protein
MPARIVREAMHEGCECINESETVLEAAKRMEQQDIGVLPICGNDDRLKGMLTDRDVVVKVLAHDMDPATKRVGELAQGTPVWVSSEASIDEALELMREHAVKRLPVIDENKKLCGIITEADIATSLSPKETGEVVGAIASAQPDHF